MQAIGDSYANRAVMLAIFAGAGLVAVAIVALIVPIERLAYAAVGALVLVITWNAFRLGGGAVASALLAVATLAVAGQTVLARRPVPMPAWLLAAGIGFALAGMLNLIFPPDHLLLDRTLLFYRTDHFPPPIGPLVPRSNVAELAKFEAAVLLIPVLIASVATTAKRIERLIDLFVVSTTVNAAVAVVDFVGIPIAVGPAYGGRESGLTIQPNYLALTCTIGVPLALLWVSRGGRWRVAGLAATVLLLGGEYVSGSRAGAVSFLLAVVATVAVIPRLRRALGVVLPTVGMVLIALLLFTKAGNQALEQVRLQGSSGVSGSDRARSDAASIAIQQFQARPVQGVGFGVIEDAHNIYLQLLAAGGVIALGAFLTYVGGLWGAIRRALGGPLRDAAAAAGVALLTWLVNGALDSQLADKYLYVIPGLLLAMSCVASAATAVQDRRVSTAAHGAASTESGQLPVATS